MSHIEYRSNNSGGYWWLTDQNWLDLEKAGWEVEWVREMTEDVVFRRKGEDRWLGALAHTAIRRDVSMRVAMAEFEDVTRQSPYDMGCDCCGQPHDFSEYDDEGKWIG